MSIPSETSSITASVEFISPTYARQLLDSQYQNRKPIRPAVDKVKTALLANKYRINGETIIISYDGRLLDGQHRCLASVETGIGFHSLVARGVEATSWTSIDAGKSRQTSDVLGALEIPDRNSAAAALGIIQAISTSKMGVHAWEACSQQDSPDFYAQHSAISASLDKVRILSRTGGLSKGFPRSQIAALHYLFSAVNPTEADKLIADLLVGAGLAADDNALILRNRILQDTQIKLKTSNKVPRGYYMSLLIKVWNARATGKLIKFLRMRLHKTSKESWPSIVGLVFDAEGKPQRDPSQILVF